MRHRFSFVSRHASLLLLFVSTSFSFNVFARPDMTPLGPNIADKGSAYYHFSTQTFDSADGNRHYKVWVAQPNKAPPSAGYPVIYMLDGNAVMDKLSEPLLQKLSEGNPPLLVVVGYQTTLPFDVKSRTFDYTPPDKEHGSVGYTFSRGRTGGGSELFRALLEQRIAPAAERGVKVNQQQRALWGHSYGGLFVLDSYLSSSFFSHYYAASPSIGQGYASLLSQLQALTAQQAGAKQLTLMEGNGDSRRDPHSAKTDVLRAVPSTVNQMAAHQLVAHYQLYPGLSHGQMFGASLQHTLTTVAQSATP